jgi:hypothetical protein
MVGGDRRSSADPPLPFGRKTQNLQKTSSFGSVIYI